MPAQESADRSLTWPDARRVPTIAVAAEAWPLIGRDEELRLVGSLTRRHSAAGGVVLAGAAGVGKTRLAQEVLAEAARRGALTRWAAATASARVLPLGAFTAMVAAVDPDAAGLVRRAGDALMAGAGPGGVVIGVDDGHLLDDVSALLVHQLVLGRAATVVMTLRSGEPAPDAVTALWKDGHIPRVELRPLSADETAQLVEAALGGSVESATARRLWSITRGNVLYLRELVRGEREAGRLHVNAGVWRWSGIPHLSPGLMELVRERIGAISDAERDVIEVLAFGEPLGVPLLARLTTPEAVERTEARGLVDVKPDGRRLEARLAHPLYGEVQRMRCGRLRARRLRGRIAAALADTGSRRVDDILRRAVLAVDSDLAPDPELMVRAARRAASLVDAPLAARLARAAIAAGAGFGARQTLAAVLVGFGRIAEAELDALAAHAGSDRERVRTVALRVTSLAWMAAQPAEAEALLAATELAVTDQMAHGELAAVRVAFDACMGRLEPAVATAADVLADEADPSQASQAIACWGLTVALGGMGRVDALPPVVERGLAEAARSADTAWIAIPLTGWHVLAMRRCGYLRDAQSLALRCQERFAGQPLAEPITSVIAGWAAYARGRIRTAARHQRDAHAGLANHGLAGGWTFACLLDLPKTLSLLGDQKAAQEALVALQDARHPGFAGLFPEVELARAWVLAGEDALSEAIGAARESAAAAAANAHWALEMQALHLAVCFGDRQAADRLAELAVLVEGPLAPAAAAHASALATGDAAALLAVSTRFEEMDALLPALDSAAQAAAVRASRGDRGEAQAAARAHLLAAACEGVRTPALRLIDQPLPLTDREREIAALAAAGRSNREIAARMTLSVRTVEGHVYRACGKLGVTDRAALDQFFDRGGRFE
jgi:DNA-binding CsgD family transcriptional regulator